MAEERGGVKPGGKNITVPSTATMRQKGACGQAGGAAQVAQRQRAVSQQANQAAPAQAKQG